MASYILLVTVYSFLLLEILLIIKSSLYTRRERKTQRPSYTPNAAIIAPHYGWDAQTEENVKRLLDQDYAGRYEVVFVTHATGESGYDVSYPHLIKLVEQHANARVLLAPNIVDNFLPRSQKVQNLMTAISTLSDDVEVIAFVDADVAIQRDWLTLLAQPLQDRIMGATVGARFYCPHTLNTASLVEAIWVNFQMAFQGDNPLAMVWGGSNAIRRETFEAGKVLQRWENAPIEDHNLTHAVRSLKLKVHFVPDCIAITHTENRTWKQVMEFTNRQMVWTFWMGLKAQWAISLLMFLPKACLVLGSIPLAFYFNHLFPVLLVPFIEIQSYRLFTLNLPRWLRDMPKVRETIRIASLVTPISMCVAGLNAVYVLFQNKIVWGGVRYEILSATTCRVLGRVTQHRKGKT
ncbi:MAG: glycosyltransferase family 2 protein [Candidatus Poribacteria bacterium]|nr:glycosyltransferase family 2 protein [Candidatus Poribacteria bacterium]